MKRNRGFTLVELLVVMAIIAILASIVVPNVAAYLRRAQATRALGEIQSIELALTKMVSDAGRSGLGDLFTKTPGLSVSDQLGIVPGNMTAAQFRQATTIYTQTIYALMREGRAIMSDGENVPGIAGGYASILDRNAISKLGTQYLDIGFDPFGQLYRIYPGPWSARNRDNPFRSYLNDGNSSLPGSRAQRQDNLTSPAPADPTNPSDPAGVPAFAVIDPETEEVLQVGYAAPRDQLAFIWSTGLNTISGQAIYSAQAAQLLPNPSYPDQNKLNYYEAQEPELMFGGDDINNWDSNRSWERFY